MVDVGGEQNKVGFDRTLGVADIDRGGVGHFGAQAGVRDNPREAIGFGFLDQRRRRVEAASKRGANCPRTRTVERRHTRADPRSIAAVLVPARAGRDGRGVADIVLCLCEQRRHAIAVVEARRSAVAIRIGLESRAGEPRSGPRLPPTEASRNLVRWRSCSIVAPNWWRCGWVTPDARRWSVAVSLIGVSALRPRSKRSLRSPCTKALPSGTTRPGSVPPSRRSCIAPTRPARAT